MDLNYSRKSFKFALKCNPEEKLKQKIHSRLAEAVKKNFLYLEKQKKMFAKSTNVYTDKEIPSTISDLKSTFWDILCCRRRKAKKE